MKKYLTLFLLVSFTTIYSQKKELRTANKDLEKGNFDKAEISLDAAEVLLSSMDEKQKSEFYLIKSKLLLRGGAAGPEETKLSVSSFEKVLEPYDIQSKEIHLVNLINHLIIMIFFI